MSEAVPLLLVTGGSRGIGAAVALRAARDGFAVMVNYVAEAEAAGRVVAAITGQGGQAWSVRGDMGEEADVLRLFAAADATGLRLAGLVNNAGITGGFARGSEVSAATLRRVLAVNVEGAILASREAVRRMSTRLGGQGGVIVNISSRAAQLGGSGEWVHYGASKGAIDTLTVGMAREVAAEGVRVNAVSPGLIDTDIHAAAGESGRVARMMATIPMGRAGTAEEVAEAVAWLLSPAASYITGANLPVSGGR